MHIHCLQHEAHEGAGIIEEWCRAGHHAFSLTRVFADEPLPQTNEIDLLLIMGGSMGALEESRFPWLVTEKRYIESCILKNIKVLGICLGAQLMADVCGSRVYKNREKEIGWFPVSFSPEYKKSMLFETFPETITALHWHGDTFDGTTLR